MLSYLIPFLSVMVGYAFVVLLRPKQSKKFRLLLSFSGAFLLALTVFHLLPELFHHQEEEHLHTKMIGIFIIVGILLQIILEYFSKGAEHGHIHQHSQLNQFPWALFVSLSIHAVLEGFPLHYHSSLVYGIFIHKLPISIILTVFFINAKTPPLRIFAFLFLFSLMTPLGTLLSEKVPSLATYHEMITAVVVGIFLHISSVILFESSEGHKFNAYKMGSILLGFITAYFV